MGHHVSNDSFYNESPESLKKLMAELELKNAESNLNEISKSLGLGPTGKFPDGKIASNDEGGIAFGITILHSRIVMDFGKPIQSIGFTKDEAINLANYLFEKARTL